jgi:hypothetical protein
MKFSKVFCDAINVSVGEVDGVIGTVRPDKRGLRAGAEQLLSSCQQLFDRLRSLGNRIRQAHDEEPRGHEQSNTIAPSSNPPNRMIDSSHRSSS